ncbi:glycosyltransferase [Cryobacterium sp. Y62]|uniref:glycosyltransferase n=1 Tax=Cryobacterium sp. Y62 TaxID=2048284 RepID=UPI000CE2CB1E|nr:glycosyltransferase [Cryobacterium sp. Y62]
MKIVQIVTLISPDAEYGGPVRVAVNQAKELIRRGHQVTIFGGTRGYATLPTEIDGVPVRLFRVWRMIPNSGFAGLISLSLSFHVFCNVRRFDLIHVHMARDLITLPAAAIALLRRVPLVIQSHGMIDYSSKTLAGLLDALLTRRVLQRAGAIFYLTPKEKNDLTVVGRGRVSLLALANGVPRSELVIETVRPNLEVLFLARLQDRKRPKVFVAAARTLLDEGHIATFALVGPDEGAAGGLAAEIDGAFGKITWEGAISSEMTIARMRHSSIYVLPSVDEPFPMSVLEAMSIGLPVIVTHSCGLAPSIVAAGAGIVVDHSQSALTDAVRTLVSDKPRRERMGLNALALARDKFSMTPIGLRLETDYADILGHAKLATRIRRENRTE